MPSKTWENLDEAKRLRVFHAAQMEFGTRGFHGGSLNVIAQEADVSKGSLYQYFEDKLDMWVAVCEMGTAEIAEHLLARTPPQEEVPLFEWLHLFLDEFITYFLEHERSRVAATAVWLEMDRRARRAAQRIVHDAWAWILGPAIDASKEAGLIRDDLPPEVLLSQIERTFRLMEWAPFLPEADPYYDLSKHGPEELRTMAHAEIEFLRGAWSPPSA